MRKRLVQIAIAATISVSALIFPTAQAQAAQINLWANHGQTGGFDYRTTNDTTFANNVFDSGATMMNNISSVINYNSTARLCTGTTYTGTCASFVSYQLTNLGSPLNNNFESIFF